MLITIKNDFHNSTAKVWLNDDGSTTLCKAVVRRIKRTLCGIRGCFCGGILGQHGKQDVVISDGSEGSVVIKRGVK